MYILDFDKKEHKLFPSGISSDITAANFHKMNINKNVKYGQIFDQQIIYLSDENKLYHIGQSSSGTDGSGNSVANNYNQDLNGV